METTEIAPETGAPPPPDGRRNLWKTGALLAVVAILFVSSMVGLRRDRARRSDETSRLALESLLQARQIYMLVKMGGPSSDQIRKQQVQLLDNLKRLANSDPSPPTIRRLALMQYTLGSEGWESTLLRLRAVPQEGSPFEAERELDLWRRVLDSNRIKPGEIPSVRARIGRMQLGWYRHLAMEAAYRRAGMDEAAAGETNAAKRSSFVLVGFVVLGFCVGLVGLVLGVTAVLYLLFGGSRLALGPRLTRPQADALYNVFLAYLAAFAAVRLGAELILRPLLGGRLEHLSLASNLQISLALMLLSLIAPFLVFLRYMKRGTLTPQDIGFRSSNLLLDAVWGIGGYMVAFPLVWIVTLLSTWIFRGFVTPTNPAINMFAGAPNLAVQLFLFAQAAIVAPIVEETTFRGIFYGALAPRVGFFLAMLIASAVFAILHPQLPLGFLGIFVLGFVFNVIRGIRNSLAPSMIAHAVNNGTILIALALLIGD